ncbi:MAG: hypothetical protein N2645_04980 [Clostridia bacterium]|nr:hypothetical protein [Clostridia bacterium]
MKLLRVMVIFIAVFISFGSLSFAEEGFILKDGKKGFMKDNNFIPVPADIKDAVKIGAKEYKINFDIFKEKGLIVYGNFKDVPQNEFTIDETGQTQNKFLGYDINGNPFFNIYYPENLKIPVKSWEKKWIKEPWTEGKCLKSKLNLDKYFGKALTAQVQQKGEYWWNKKNAAGEVWTADLLFDTFNIQSAPSTYIPGKAVGWFEYEGTTIPETVHLIPQLADFKAEIVEAPKEGYTGSFVEVKVKVSCISINGNPQLGKTNAFFCINNKEVIKDLNFIVDKERIETYRVKVPKGGVNVRFLINHDNSVNLESGFGLENNEVKCFIASKDFDIKTEIVDSGVPAGQKAKPGEKYIAKVRYYTSIGVDKVCDSSFLCDETYLLKGALTINDQTKQGITGDFIYREIVKEWICPNTPKVELKSSIMKDSTEFDYPECKNNNASLTVEVDVKDFDFAVGEILYGKYLVNKNAESEIIVKNKGSTPAIKVPVKLTIINQNNNSVLLKENKFIDVPGNSESKVKFFFKTPAEKGKLVLKAEVNVDRTLYENNMSDNVRQMTAELTKVEGVESISLYGEGSKTWSEPHVSHYENNAPVFKDYKYLASIQGSGNISFKSEPGNKAIQTGYGFSLQLNTNMSVQKLEHNNGSLLLDEVAGARSATVTFLGKTYKMELTSSSSRKASFQLARSANSKSNGRKIFIPLDTKDGTYEIVIRIDGARCPSGSVPMTIKKQITVRKGSSYEDDYKK